MVQTRGFESEDRGIEADNFELGYAFTLLLTSSITNLTLVGPEKAP
jgi:hypothetical protein